MNPSIFYVLTRTLLGATIGFLIVAFLKHDVFYIIMSSTSCGIALLFHIILILETILIELRNMRNDRDGE